MKKGRTLWEIFTSDPPKESESFNPLKAKIGQYILLADKPNINFAIENIAQYKTMVRDKVFWHTDYLLCGTTPEGEYPTHIRLRLIPDENTPVNYKGTDTGFDKMYHVQILYLIDEFEWDETFYNEVLTAECFNIHQDEFGYPLETPKSFERVDGVKDPYDAQIILENEKYSLKYWDYVRIIEKDEYLWVEMFDSKYFMMYGGVNTPLETITLV